MVKSSKSIQESLANSSTCMKAPAKKSMANQRKEHSVEKYIQLLTTLSLTILVYLHSFSC